MKKNQQLLFRSFHYSMLTVGLIVGLAAMPSDAGAELSERDVRSEGNIEYVSNADGSLTINFAEQSREVQPRFTRAALAADEGVADSHFRGDYIAGGVAGVTFQVRADATPYRARLVLFGAQSGRIWWRDIDIAPTGGDWVNVEVALSRNDMWDRNVFRTAANWEADLTDVDVIGLEIQPGSRDAQSYTIAEFLILDAAGSAIGGEAELSPLERELLDTFGVTSISALTAADRLQDSDGDGMKDWERILAEHDDSAYIEMFEVRNITATDEGVKIRFLARKGSVYDVYRAKTANLGDPDAFELLPAGTEIAADRTENKPFVDVDTQPGVNYAYRVYRLRADNNTPMGD